MHKPPETQIKHEGGRQANVLKKKTGSVKSNLFKIATIKEKETKFVIIFV